MINEHFQDKNSEDSIKKTRYKPKMDRSIRLLTCLNYDTRFEDHFEKRIEFIARTQCAKMIKVYPDLLPPTISNDTIFSYSDYFMRRNLIFGLDNHLDFKERGIDEKNTDNGFIYYQFDFSPVKLDFSSFSIPSFLYAKTVKNFCTKEHSHDAHGHTAETFNIKKFNHLLWRTSAHYPRSEMQGFSLKSLISHLMESQSRLLIINLFFLCLLNVAMTNGLSLRALLPSKDLVFG
jgi:hypothetical protein